MLRLVTRFRELRRAVAAGRPRPDGRTDAATTVRTRRQRPRMRAKPDHDGRFNWPRHAPSTSLIQRCTRAKRRRASTDGIEARGRRIHPAAARRAIRCSGKGPPAGPTSRTTPRVRNLLGSCRRRRPRVPNWHIRCTGTRVRSRARMQRPVGQPRDRTSNRSTCSGYLTGISVPDRAKLTPCCTSTRPVGTTKALTMPSHSNIGRTAYGIPVAH